jgi:hypothetical protein
LLLAEGDRAADPAAWPPESGGIKGRQLADAARGARPELKVLLITGYAENAIIGGGQLSPGMRQLPKPFVVETFAARVLEIIENKK